MPVELKQNIPKNPNLKVPWQDLKIEIQSKYIQSQKYGKLHLLLAGEETWQNSVIFLHGCNKITSNAYEFSHFFNAFIYHQYKCIAIDMPGYGKSEG